MSDEKPPPGNPALKPADATGADAIFSASGIGITGTQWFLQLNFQDSIAASQGVMERTAIVVKLAWPLAKALHEMLGQSLRGYEASEGEVSIPRSFVNRPKKTPPKPQRRQGKKAANH